MLGQRWEWSPRIGQHIACGNHCIAHGRQLGCTQRWCTHQYRYHHHNNYVDDDNNNNYDNVNHNHDGRVNFHNYLFDNIVNDVFNNIIVDYDFINDNNTCATGDHRSVNYNNDCATNNHNYDYNNHNYDYNNHNYDYNNHNYDYNNHNYDYNNHTSARCYSITHGQRIRQQFICVKRCTKTATQQTWCSAASWRFGVVRGVSTVQRPQSPQPAHGQTFAIGVHLSLNPRSWAAGHPKRPVRALGPGTNFHG